MKTSTPCPSFTRWLQLCPLLILLSVPAARLAAQEAVPTLLTNPPAFGTFYWLSGLPSAPYPFDPARGLLPIWSLNGAYYVDDSELLQNLGGGMMLMGDPSPPDCCGGGGGGGGGGTNCCNSLTNFTLGYSTNGALSLGIAPTTNPWIALTIQTPTTNLSYDAFGTTNMAELALPSLSRTNWTWLMRANGRATNFSWGETNWCERYFQLGTMQDSDNDGLTDAYETLVSRTPTNIATSPRVIYEAVISNQNPSAWFKLNDTNLSDAQGGLSLTNGGGAWDPDAFAIGNSAITFTSDTNRLTLGDVISGGSGTNQGSMCLLFRSLQGLATTRRFVFWQEDSINSNRFGVFFEDDNTGPYPGNLCLQIGGQTNVLLASNAIVFEAWYYLALTWDETRADTNGAEVTWYLGRVGETLTNGTVNLADGAVVGNSTTVYLGNRHSADRALRSPGNGALDEIAFWNCELPSADVNTQFDTLKVLFQGPAKVFDLSRWNLLLPVDKLNQVNSNNAPLKITWANSGFKYVDPTNWTQKYFYLTNGTNLVFDAPWNGADTDTTGNSARSELRETLPNGSDRNWLPLGTNILEATCMVNSAGTNSKSKVIIGQIHGDNLSDPPVAISYNFPDLNPGGKVTVTVKDNPNGTTDRNFTLATNSLNTPINYKLELVGTTNAVVLTATINGQTRDIIIYQEGDSVRTNALWKSTAFYFKAGAYYPKATNSGTAKVTFSRLVITPQQ
jgi:hypothetical protein